MSVVARSASVLVPNGWVREVSSGDVHYISPDNTILRNRDELLCYLLADGTCKCGLRCPFQLDEQFSFESTVISLPDIQVSDFADSCSCIIARRENQGSCEMVLVTGGSDQGETGETGELDNIVQGDKDMLDLVETRVSPVKSNKKKIACEGEFILTKDQALVPSEADVSANKEDDSDGHEVSLPVSVQLGSLSDGKFHAKFVDLLRTVDRCFQLLQPQPVPSPERCSNRDILRQHTIAGRLDFPEANSHFTPSPVEISRAGAPLAIEEEPCSISGKVLTELTNSDVEGAKDRVPKVEFEPSLYSLLPEEAKTLSSSGQTLPWTILDTENNLCPLSSKEVEMQCEPFTDSNNSDTLSSEMPLASSNELCVSNAESVMSLAAISAVPPTLMSSSTNSIATLSLPVETTCSGSATLQQLQSEASTTVPKSLLPIRKPSTLNGSPTLTVSSVSALDLAPLMANSCASNDSPLSSILTPPHSAIIPLTPVCMSPGSPLTPPCVITPESPDRSNLIDGQAAFQPPSSFCFAGRVMDTASSQSYSSSSGVHSGSELSSHIQSGTTSSTDHPVSATQSHTNSTSPSSDIHSGSASNTPIHSSSISSYTESNSCLSSVSGDSMVHSSSKTSSHAHSNTNLFSSDRVLRSAVSNYAPATTQLSSDMKTRANSNLSTPKRRSRRFKSTPVKSWSDSAMTTPPSSSSQSKDTFIRVAVPSITTPKVQNSLKTFSISPSPHPLISGLHNRVTRSCDPPPLSSLSVDNFLDQFPSSRQTPTKNSTRLKDFTIDMTHSKTVPRPCSNISKKMEPSSLSPAKDVLLKNFHIPLVDCGSNSPPKSRRQSLRPRRHTLGHTTLTSIKKEAERMLSATTLSGKESKGDLANSSKLATQSRMILRSRSGKLTSTGKGSEQTVSGVGSDSSSCAPPSATASPVSSPVPLVRVSSRVVQDSKIALPGITPLSTITKRREGMRSSVPQFSGSAGPSVDIVSASHLPGSSERPIKSDVPLVGSLNREEEPCKMVSASSSLTSTSGFQSAPAQASAGPVLPIDQDLLQSLSTRSKSLSCSKSEPCMVEKPRRNTRSSQNVAICKKSKDMEDVPSTRANSIIDELGGEKDLQEALPSNTPQGLLVGVVSHASGDTAEEITEHAQELKESLPGGQMDRHLPLVKGSALQTPCQNISNGSLSCASSKMGKPSDSVEETSHLAPEDVDQFVIKDDNSKKEVAFPISRVLKDIFFSCESSVYPVTVPIAAEHCCNVLSWEQIDLWHSMQRCPHKKKAEEFEKKSRDRRGRKPGKKRKPKVTPRATAKKRVEPRKSSKNKSKSTTGEDKDEDEVEGDPQKCSQENQASVEVQFERKADVLVDSQKVGDSGKQEKLAAEEGPDVAIKSEESGRNVCGGELTEKKSEVSPTTEDECKTGNGPSLSTESGQDKQVGVLSELESKDVAESAQMPDSSACKSKLEVVGDSTSDRTSVDKDKIKEEGMHDRKDESDPAEEVSTDNVDNKGKNVLGDTNPQPLHQEQLAIVEDCGVKKKQVDEVAQSIDNSSKSKLGADPEGKSAAKKGKKGKPKTKGSGRNKVKRELVPNEPEGKTSNKKKCKSEGKLGSRSQQSELQDPTSSNECKLNESINHSEDVKKSGSIHREIKAQPETLSGKKNGKRKAKSTENSKTQKKRKLANDNSKSCPFNSEEIKKESKDPEPLKCEQEKQSDSQPESKKSSLLKHLLEQDKPMDTSTPVIAVAQSGGSSSYQQERLPEQKDESASLATSATSLEQDGKGKEKESGKGSHAAKKRESDNKQSDGVIKESLTDNDPSCNEVPTSEENSCQVGSVARKTAKSRDLNHETLKLSSPGKESSCGNMSPEKCEQAKGAPSKDSSESLTQGEEIMGATKPLELVIQKEKNRLDKLPEDSVSGQAKECEPRGDKKEIVDYSQGKLVAGKMVCQSEGLKPDDEEESLQEEQPGRREDAGKSEDPAVPSKDLQEGVKSIDTSCQPGNATSEGHLTASNSQGEANQESGKGSSNSRAEVAEDQLGEKSLAGCAGEHNGLKEQSGEGSFSESHAQQVTKEAGGNPSIEDDCEMSAPKDVLSSKEACDKKSTMDSSLPTLENVTSDKAAPTCENSSPNEDSCNVDDSGGLPGKMSASRSSKPKKAKKEKTSRKPSAGSKAASSKARNSKAKKNPPPKDENDASLPGKPDSKRMREEKTEECEESFTPLRNPKRQRESSSAPNVTKSYPIRSRTSSPQVSLSGTESTNSKEKTEGDNEVEEDIAELVWPAKRKRPNRIDPNVLAAKISPQLQEKTPSSAYKNRKKNFSSQVREAWLRLCEIDEEGSDPVSLVVSIPIFQGRKRIVHHTLLECSGESAQPNPPMDNHAQEVKIGDIVWAKAHMLMAWPGKVICHEGQMEEPPRDKVWVHWYGESTRSLVSKSSILPIKEGIGLRIGRGVPPSRQLRDAIIEAIQEAIDQKTSLKEKTLSQEKLQC